MEASGFVSNKTFYQDLLQVIQFFKYWVVFITVGNFLLFRITMQHIFKITFGKKKKKKLIANPDTNFCLEGSKHCKNGIWEKTIKISGKITNLEFFFIL